MVFLRDGSEFLCCSDLVARDSADRNIMAWHFDSGVVLSNQIFQVSPCFLQTVALLSINTIFGCKFPSLMLT